MLTFLFPYEQHTFVKRVYVFIYTSHEYIPAQALS